MNVIPKNSGLVARYISYPLANFFVPIFYNLGFTPNMVTTLTLLMRIIVIYYLYHKKNYELILILFIFSWITDGVDGQIARNYNMYTKFGDYYDAIVDNITCISMLIILFMKYYQKNRLPFYIGLSFIPICLALQTIKTRCTKKSEMKVWEKEFINNENIKLTKKDCKNLKFIKLYDESVNYVIIILFLSERTYKKKFKKLTKYLYQK